MTWNSHFKPLINKITKQLNNLFKVEANTKLEITKKNITKPICNEKKEFRTGKAAKKIPLILQYVWICMNYFSDSDKANVFADCLEAFFNDKSKFELHLSYNKAL